MHQGSSLLLGIEGLIVQDVRLDAAGRRVARCVTDPELAGWCPQCGEQSSSPKGWVTTRPRDVIVGPDVPILLWRKQKWRCRVSWCERKTFTESLPAIPARSRLTARLRQRAAEAIGDHARSVADVAAEHGITWPIAHRAFISYAESLTPADGPPPPVTVLGIDETRRGKGRYEIQTDTGVKVWVDRFDTGLVDISGTGGLFAQINGRKSQEVIDWIEAQTDEWRARITHVAIDTSATYAKVVREALPHALVILDRFHLVALANRAITDYRRELAWNRRGRRGRKVDPEWAQRNRLLRARESLTDAEWVKMHQAMKTADPTGGLQKCWRAKELLRHLLKLAGTEPDWALVWQRLTDFQVFAADNIHIPQIRRLAQTVDDWRSSIIEGIFTGISNGRSEGYNRIVKHIGRIAFGFRNPANQKRRIRFACTRASRRVTTTLTPC
jgi:transposase